MANEIRFDLASDAEGEWAWYVPNDGTDCRAVERDGEWRVYFETAQEAIAETAP